MTLTLQHTQISIGLPSPVSVIHASDTHLTLADIRDGERKVALGANRLGGFPHAETVLDELGELSRGMGLPIFHTGDLLDFVSIPNLERARAFCQTHDLFLAAGNHEFSLYVGEAREDAAYRNQSLHAVQACFGNNIRMDSRVINGVNFVALDNGYYLFDEEQFEFLRGEVDKGLPVVLLMHVPLYEETLFADEMSRNPCGYLVAVPEELMRGYPPHRYEQQLADETTRRVVDYIAAQPAVKAILAGHIHKAYEGVFAGRIPQLTVGCTDARIVEFI